MALATWVRCAATRNKNRKRPPSFQLSDRKNDGTDNVGQLRGQDKLRLWVQPGGTSHGPIPQAHSPKFCLFKCNWYMVNGDIQVADLLVRDYDYLLV